MSVKEKNTIDAVYDELSSLNTFLARPEGEHMLQFLLAPHVMDDKKEALIRSVFGERTQKLITEFLIVLLEKHRIGYLGDIIREFLLMVEDHRGVGRVTVTTAITLNDGERNSLVAQLETKTGLKIRLEEKIDPAILGGMILMLKDQIIDGSVRYEIDVLRDQLSKVKVA